MTIPSYTEQLWTPYVYTQQRLIPASESAIHKNNKAPRLKSTKRWDSLNKSYCWQRAAPSMCVCVCARVSSVCWTHFRNERKCLQKVFIFLFEIYIYIAPQQRQSSCPPWSPCAQCQNYLSCVSVCPSLLVYLCVRKGVCVWVHTEWFMEATKAWPKRTKVEKDSQALCASKGFLSLLPTVLPRWQIVGVDIFPHSAIIFTILQIKSSCHPGILGQGPMLLLM